MAIEGRSDAAGGGKIRLGMVGGGEGAFIGAVHRLAARMDGHYELVAGALSATPEKARRSGEALGLAPDRVYPDYESMAKAEAARPDGIEAADAFEQLLFFHGISLNLFAKRHYRGQRGGDHLFVFPIFQFMVVNSQGEIVQQRLSDSVLARGNAELDEL